METTGAVVWLAASKDAAGQGVVSKDTTSQGVVSKDTAGQRVISKDTTGQRVLSKDREGQRVVSKDVADPVALMAVSKDKAGLRMWRRISMETAGVRKRCGQLRVETPRRG